LPFAMRPHAAAAKHAIAMSRLIPILNAWRSCLTGSCTLQEDEGLASASMIFVLSFRHLAGRTLTLRL
jgi:hypothetical protein